MSNMSRKTANMASLPDGGFKFAWPFPKKESFLYRLKSKVAMTTVHFLSKALFAANVNKIVVHNKEVFMKHLANTSRPLLTIANHRCNIDDPLLWSILTWKEFFANISRYRYTLAAHNICFSKAWHTKLFSSGRCVPVVRGAGVHQEGMDYCLEKLDERKWVHVFPEGKVTPQPIRIKWGVARLAMEAKLPPIVLPIWVNGMDSVWPTEKPYYPRFGKIVEVTVGEPLDMKTILPTLRTSSEITRRKELADILQEKLFALGRATSKKPIDSS